MITFRSVLLPMASRHVRDHSIPETIRRIGRLLSPAQERTYANSPDVRKVLTQPNIQDTKGSHETFAEINTNHRFRSFANQRTHNFVKWHIDGHDYFWAVSELLESARHVIFILDWWLSPELYLRRPCEYYPEYRLDRLLKRKAQQGVKIYIVVYKEVSEVSPADTAHTKRVLEGLHPNIVVMRHPDHFRINLKDDVEYWSHHEKVVVVDNHAACIGGFDLSFGRWDTHNHPLADVHPTEFGRTLFPGQDYNNARILDFQDVKDFVGNSISTLDTPRMPWHDVNMSLIGPAVLDIIQHFVERWNFVKKIKYKNDAKYEWLAFPHAIDGARNEAIAPHPDRERFSHVGHRYAQHSYGKEAEDNHPSPSGSCRVQAIRSVCEWSHGVKKECSIQTAYCQLIQEAKHFIYIENQFFISSTQNEGPVVNRIAQALVERIIKAAREKQKFKVVVVIPEAPGNAGPITNMTVRTILVAQYRTINRGGYSIYELIRKAGYEPMDYIRFYNLRSYDRINAPWDSYLHKVEAKSNVDLYHAQAAQARKWIGEEWAPDSSHNVKIAEFRAKATSRIIDKDTTDEGIKTVTVPMPKTLNDAKVVVEKWKAAARKISGVGDISDTVGGHALQDKTALSDEKWLGTKEEERFAYVSGLLYIHTKLMIVDDRRVIMGSANLNDRSMKGDGDSEIALVVEDEDMIQTTMNGKSYQAARFAATLRRKLWREHLGLIKPQNCQQQGEPITSFMRPAPIPNMDETQLPEDVKVADPLLDKTLALWQNIAKTNTEIFTELFKPVPTNLVRNKKQYEKYLPDVKAGHVVPGVRLARVKARLSEVRGHVVECPLDFMIEDKAFLEDLEWTKFNAILPVYI